MITLNGAIISDLKIKREFFWYYSRELYTTSGIKASFNGAYYTAVQCHYVCAFATSDIWLQSFPSKVHILSPLFITISVYGDIIQSIFFIIQHNKLLIYKYFECNWPQTKTDRMLDINFLTMIFFNLL